VQEECNKIKSNKIEKECRGGSANNSETRILTASVLVHFGGVDKRHCAERLCCSRGEWLGAGNLNGGIKVEAKGGVIPEQQGKYKCKVE
jgi:hypothetical protein